MSINKISPNLEVGKQLEATVFESHNSLKYENQQCDDVYKFIYIYKRNVFLEGLPQWLSGKKPPAMQG